MEKMVETVIDNIKPANTDQVILITRTHHTTKDELVNYHLDSTIIELNKPTDGSLQTILQAKELVKYGEIILANL